MRDRLTRLETRLESLVDKLASRDWVRDLIEPIRESAFKTEHAVSTLAKESSALYAAHDQLLKERAERERQMHEAELERQKSNSFYALLRDKWAPLLGLFLAGAGGLKLLGDAITFWVTHAR